MNLSLQLIDAGIVHEELQKIFLPVNLGWVPQNVTVIPHGAEVLEAGGVPDVVESKKEYGLQGKDVVMCLGWWEEYKRFEDVVEIWPQVVRNVSDAALVIAGDARPGSPGGIRYKPKLLKAVAQSPAKDSIIIIQGSFRPKEYLTVEKAADIVVLPYEQSSQSGVGSCILVRQACHRHRRWWFAHGSRSERRGGSRSARRPRAAQGVHRAVAL